MRLTSTKLLNASLTLTQCLNIILQKYASPNDVIVLETKRTVMNFKVLRFDTERGNISDDFSTHFPDFYVIEVSSAADLWEFLQKTDKNHEYLRNTRGKYLFISKYFSLRYIHLITANFLTNAIFMNTKTRIIRSINPYVDGKLSRSGGRWKTLGKCDDEFQEYETFYKSDIPKKGEKHEMTVGYYAPSNNIYRYFVNYSRPGLEIEIINTILEHLNINHSFISKNTADLSGFTYPEDILICGCSLIDTNMHEQSAIYNVKYMKWMVPVPEKIQRRSYILLVFGPICWILFLIGLLSILIGFFLMKHTNLYSDKFSTVQVLFVIFLGRTKRFRTKYVALDILIFCIVFWSVMINYLFSSKLQYLLNGIKYEKGIETIEDIPKNHLFIATKNNYYEILVKDLPEFSDYPPYLFKYYPTPGKSWGDVAGHNKIAIILSSDTIRLQKNYFTNKKTGLMYLKELEPPFKLEFVGALFMKGHPFFDYFNRHVQYFIESGLSGKIIKYYEAPKWKQPTLEPTQKLKLEHIEAPMMILAVGLMFSQVAFFFELMKWKYTSRSTR